MDRFWGILEPFKGIQGGTDDGLDVSAIAAQYGGGGHARAAGFKVPRDHELARA